MSMKILWLRVFIITFNDKYEKIPEASASVCLLLATAQESNPQYSDGHK